LGPWDRFKYTLWRLLAFTRIPGNALSFGIRRALHWSRGRPELWQEGKEDLFAYLGEDAPEAETREARIRAAYGLDPLKALSTANLYRKNLYLIECLEKAVSGIPPPVAPGRGIRAVDVGSQDWHYVFGLERWLGSLGRPVRLTGIEVDGFGIYPDFHSRKDYALAYAGQTGNPEVDYRVLDFLRCGETDVDLVTIFYPFVTRHALLLWGLPLGLFDPGRMVAKASALLRPGGWLIVFNHTSEEHARFQALGRASGRLELLREGRAFSDLVDFHPACADRRFSVWRRLPGEHPGHPKVG
jgi:hypothetical protein